MNRMESEILRHFGEIFLGVGFSLYAIKTIGYNKKEDDKYLGIRYPEHKSRSSDEDSSQSNDYRDGFE